MKNQNKTQTPKNKKNTTAKKMPKRKSKAGSPHEKDHDALARVGFSDIKGVRGLLQTELPEDLKAALDFSTLQRISDSYTDESLKSTYSDKAFTCKSLEGETAIIAFICEHKSYIPNEPIHIQLLKYEVNHWQDTILAGEPIACIITIVIYHGEHDWAIKPFADYFNLKTPVFRRYIPQFEIIFINLRSMPEEKITANPLLGKLRAVLLSLKYSHNPNVLLEYFNFILNFVLDSDGNVTEVEIRYFNAVVEYLQRRTLITEEEYLQKIDNLNDDLKTMATSTYHTILRNAYKRAKIEVQAEVRAEVQAEVRAEVQAEVRAKLEELVTNLLLEFNFKDDKIANLANVPLEFVKQIRDKLAKRP